MSGEEEVKHSLEAMAACTKEDIVHWNWSIELVNSQVFLSCTLCFSLSLFHPLFFSPFLTLSYYSCNSECFFSKKE